MDFLLITNALRNARMAVVAVLYSNITYIKKLSKSTQYTAIEKQIPMRTILLDILFTYIALTLFGYFFSERVIFQPQPTAYRDVKETIKLKTADGALISAVYLPNPDARYTLLYSHGNAEDLATLAPFLEALRKMGFSVLAYDYHGYGTSTGAPSEKNAYADSDAAYNYLTQQLHIAPKQIIAHGRSLGGAVAADLASRHPVGGLILESTFLSAYRVKIPLPIFLFDRFKTAAKLKKINVPVLVIHGTQDEVISFWHGEALYAQAKPPKKSLWVDGAHHNDLFRIAGPRYEQAIKDFADHL